MTSRSKYLLFLIPLLLFMLAGVASIPLLRVGAYDASSLSFENKENTAQEFVVASPFSAVFSKIQFSQKIEDIMPTWARWFFVFLVIMLVFLVGGILFLRTQTRKRTAALEEAEYKYRSLVDNSLVGFYITQKNTLRFASAGCAKLFGYDSAEEMIGMNVQGLVVPTSWNKVDENVQKRESKTTKINSYRFQGLRKDGYIIDVEALGTRVIYEGKVAIQGILIDITERVRAEERFKRLSEASLESLFISEKGICIEANLAAEKLFGYSQEEAVGMSATDIIVPEYRDIVIHHILSNYDEPYRVIALRKDGSTFPAEINGRMMRYKGRALRVTSIRDISRQVRTEESLLESEKRYRNLFENMPVGVYRTTPSGKILDANTAFLKMLGYPDKETLANTNVTSLYIKAGDRERLLSNLEKKELVKKHEMKIQQYNGGIIWVQDTFRVVRDENDEILYFEGALEDVTERVEAEEKLRKSKERFERVIAQAPIPMAITLPNGDTEYFNHKFVETFGYTLEDLSQAEQWWSRIYPDEKYRALVKKAWEKELAKASESGTQTQTQIREITRKDGEIRIVEFDMMPLGDISIITMNDITEFTKAQKELKSHLDQLISQNRINTALSASLNLEKLLDIILEEVERLLKFDAVAVFLKEKNGDLTIAKATGEACSFTGRTFPIEETALNMIDTKAVILDDAQANSRFLKWDDTAISIRGWMGLPLIVRDLVVGYLTFDSRAPRAFSPQDADLAESFTPHIAQAIYNARLHKEIQENLQQLETLNTITGALSTSLDLDNLLELILEQIRSVIHLDSGAIFLYEEDKLRVAVDCGISPSVKGQVFPRETKLFNKIKKTKSSLILNYAQKNVDFQNWGINKNIKHWLGVPLLARDEMIGFLTLDSHDIDIFYSNEHVNLVQPFAFQAAQAIYNARLYERVIKDSNEMEKRVQERTEELQNFVNLTAGREIRMAKLKETITKLRTQLIEAGQIPAADDPLRYPN